MTSRQDLPAPPPPPRPSPLPPPFRIPRAFPVGSPGAQGFTGGVGTHSGRSLTVSAVRRIIVGVSESPGSLQALRHAADLARRYRAALVPIHAWTPPGGDLADRSHPSPYLRQLWHDAAWQRLWKALDLAFGGVPEDVTV